MKFLEVKTSTKELEKEIKNKWRWEWLSEKDETGLLYEKWLKKPDIAGVAFCVPCGKTINYKSNGKRLLKQHACDSTHKKKLRVVKSNQVLPGSSKATPATESLQDRIAKQRVLTVSFLSEHCLPFSLADDLVKLAQRQSTDNEALQKMSLSKTSTAYITTHGVSRSFKDDLKQKLKNVPVSINIDEATNNSNDKIMNDLKPNVFEAHLGALKRVLSQWLTLLPFIDQIMI